MWHPLTDHRVWMVVSFVLWAAAGVGAGLAAFADPDAISMAIGCAIPATVCTGFTFWLWVDAP